MDNLEFLFSTLAGFIQVGPDERKLIASFFTAKHFKKGELFLQEGSICNNLGFLCKGIFRYYIEQDHEDKTYNFAKEGEFICHYESLIKQTPSSKHIQALEPSEVLIISRENLQRFFSEVKEGDRFGRIHMENVYADTIRQLISQYTETPEHRYLRFLEKHYDLHQRLPQYYVASFVGVKPQSLSRIRKRLAAKARY